MQSIITQMLQMVKANANPLAWEEALQYLFQDWREELVLQALGALDKALYWHYKQEGWRVDRLERRTVQFTFGKLTFQRRRLRKKGEKSFLPLDQAIGLEKRKRYSLAVRKGMAELGARLPFRQASQVVRLLTPLTISHTTLHTMTQEIGEHLQNYSEHRPEPDASTTKRKEVPVLFIEGDGLCLKSRDGEPLTLHRLLIHEGLDRRKKRTRLIHPFCFVSTQSSAEAFRQLSHYLNHHYQLKQTLVISNSDGGSGYEADKFEMAIGACRQHEHCRDPYHVNRKIKDRLSFDRPMEYRLRKALRAYDWTQIESVLATAQSRVAACPSEIVADRLDQIERLRGYLSRHWPYLQPIADRSLPVQKGTGVCETGHRYYSYRLKHQGRAWTHDGARHVAAILNAVKNKEYARILTQKVDPTVQSLGEDIKGAVKAALRTLQPATSQVQQGHIVNQGPSSSPIGKLAKMFR